NIQSESQSLARILSLLPVAIEDLGMVDSITRDPGRLAPHRSCAREPRALRGVPIVPGVSAHVRCQWATLSNILPATDDPATKIEAPTASSATRIRAISAIPLRDRMPSTIAPARISAPEPLAAWSASRTI